MKYKLYNKDLPTSFQFSKIVAIDTETMGLKLNRDRLCLVQISNGDGIAHLIKIPAEGNNKFSTLVKMFRDKSITKIFHYARFDIAVIQKNICEINGPIFCTKIASKLSRTFGAKHGLKDLCSDLLGIELDKENQISDWGTDKLSEQQLRYASNDVLYLHALKTKLNELLKREQKYELAHKCFEFIKTRSKLDLEGFDDLDIFSQ